MTEEKKQQKNNADRAKEATRAAREAAEAGNRSALEIKDSKGNVLFRATFTVLVVIGILLLLAGGISFGGLLAGIIIVVFLLLYTKARFSIVRENASRQAQIVWEEDKGESAEL